MKTRKTKASLKVYLPCAFCALLALGASGATRTWTGNAGYNEWATDANWSDNAVPVAGDVANFNSNGATITVEVTNDCVVQQIQVNGTANVVLNIASGKRLNVANAGSAGIQAFTGDLTINGPGTLGLTTVETVATGINHLDNGAEFGRTLTINAQITDTNGTFATGFETWRPNAASKGGTVVLGNPGNAFAMAVQIGNNHTLVAPKLADSGQPSSIGAGPDVVPNRASILRYTGTGDSTDRNFLLNGGDATHGYGAGIEQAGTGPLIWAGPVYNRANNAQTLALLGDSASPAYITGDISNSTGTLGIRKDGTGTWMLSGSNTFTGDIAVNDGTLGLDSASAAGNAAQITMAPGTTLSVNPSGTDGFSATIPQVNAPGGVTLTVTPAETSSTVTLNTLNVSQAAFVAPEAGTASNRIFISGLATGFVGSWLTLNGGLAQYDPVNGLAPAALPPPTGNIKTKDDTLPDGATIRAVIDTPAYTGNPITLTAAPTSLYSLTQAVPDDDATVDLGGQMLALNWLAIAPGGNALSVINGTLTAPLAPTATGGVRIKVIRTDAATGISPAKDYTHLLSFGPTAATVNGVTFPSANATSGTVTGSDGLPYGWMNAPGTPNTGTGNLAADTTEPNQQLNTLISSMRHPGSGAPSSVTLTGLTDGESYELTFFSRHWSDFNFSRLARLTFITDGSGVPTLPFIFNTESPSVNVITFRYTLTGTNAVTLTLSNPPGESRTLHLYALTNERLPGSPVLTPVTPGILTLANAGDGPLTISATLADTASPVNLIKDGDGEIRLTGPVDTTGTIALQGDGLVFDIPLGVTRELAPMPYLRLTGPGGLTKDGEGTLSINGVNDYAGLTTVAQGTLRIGGGSPLGTSDVIVLNGAALDIGGDTASPGPGNRKYMLDGARTVTIQGVGPDGNGAYVNNSRFVQRYSTTGVTLAGDTTVGSARADIPALSEADGSISVLAQGGTFRLNGHTLTKKSDNLLSMGNGIIDTTGGGMIDIQQGTLRLHDAENTGIPSTFLGNPIMVTLANDTRLLLDNLAPAVPWSFNVGNNARLFAGSTARTNTISGSVTLAGNAIIDGNADLTLAGPVSGPGGFIKTNGVGRLILAYPDNTYQDDTLIGIGAVRVAATNALPTVNPITVNAFPPPNAASIDTISRLEVAYDASQSLPSLTLYGGLTGGNEGKSGNVSIDSTTTIESKEFILFAGLIARQFTTDTLALSSGLVIADTLTAGTFEKSSSGNATLAAASVITEAITVSGGTLTVDDPSIEDVFRIGRPIAWYDTSDASSIVTNANGFVTLLRNKGSRGASADAAPHPTTATDIFTTVTDSDGRTFIRKDTDPYAALMSNADLGITGTAPRTLFTAARRIRSDRGIHIHYGPNSNGQAFAFDIGTAVLYFYLYSNDISVNYNSLETLVLTHMSGGEGNTVLRQAWRDGLFMGQNTTVPFNTTNGRLRLFARDGANDRQGDIGEVLFFDRTLSDAERRAVERYLSRKWNVPTPALSPSLAPTTDVTLVPTPQENATAAITFPFDDATSGISTRKAYTHALDFGNNGGVGTTVNGVTFTPIMGNTPSAGVTMVGTGRAANAFTTQIPDWRNFRSLILGMLYNGGGNPTSVTISGLTPGKAYEIMLFNRPWNSDAAFTHRQMIVNFTNGAARDLLTFNNECWLAQTLTWRYVAASDAVTVTLRNTTKTQTLHLYAMTNEELPPTAADGYNLLSVLDLGSRPETIRNLTGSGTITGDGTVPLTVTGEITTPSVINFDGATPAFDGAVFKASPDGGIIHVIGTADFSALTVAIAAPPGFRLRTLRTKILSTTEGVTALPKLDPAFRSTNRLDISDDGNSVWITPVTGTLIMVK